MHELSRAHGNAGIWRYGIPCAVYRIGGAARAAPPQTTSMLVCLYRVDHFVFLSRVVRMQSYHSLASPAFIARRVAAAYGGDAVRWWYDPWDPRFLCIETALPPRRAVVVVLSAFLGADELALYPDSASPFDHIVHSYSPTPQRSGASR
jgi:hypothetical protein